MLIPPLSTVFESRKKLVVLLGSVWSLMQSLYGMVNQLTHHFHDIHLLNKSIINFVQLVIILKCSHNI
ncbi:MAG: hypothetical protein ACJ709_07225, partial [Nitrososphaeraceae archaeon]